MFSPFAGVANSEYYTAMSQLPFKIQAIRRWIRIQKDKKNRSSKPVAGEAFIY